jgi:FlaA1/EpsC-like NDP-sugar epimerase
LHVDRLPVAPATPGPLSAAPRAVGLRLVRRLRVVVLAPVMLLIYYLAYCLRFDGTPEAREFERFLLTARWILPLKLGLFAWFDVGRGWRRLVTYRDFAVLVRAATSCLVLAVLVNRFLFRWPVVPRSIYLFDWGLTIGVFGGALALIHRVGEAGRRHSAAIDVLLRRKPISLDLESLRRWIDGRTLLVTGSAGSIGSEICRQLLRFSPRRLVLVDRAETGQFFLERELRPMAGPVELAVSIADILDTPRLEALFREHAPEIVFHAAAYKHVPLMEAHPGEAVKNIVLATRRLADAAARAGVGSFVMISTDKAVNPASVMGACKRVAEMYVQSLAGRSECRFVTVRFGNVLDSSGSVVQVFRQQIAAGGPVTVTHPQMRRFFMTISEAAQLVIQAGAIGGAGEILALDMGRPVRIVDLAADMIRLAGLRAGEDIAIEFTGLRPGEKLDEELLGAGESPRPTCHPKITVADHRPASGPDVRAAIDRLENLLYAPADQIVAALEQIVPEFRSTWAFQRRQAA